MWRVRSERGLGAYATFSNENAARLQDELWRRWGHERIPKLADREPALTPALRAKLISRETRELSDELLVELLAAHPADDGAAPPRMHRGETVGEWIAKFFPTWQAGEYPGARGPKSQQTIDQHKEWINSYVFEVIYQRDERGWRVRDENGDYIVIGSDPQALAHLPLASLDLTAAYQFEQRLRELTRGQEVRRKVLGFMTQAIDHAIGMGCYPLARGNPFKHIKKPAQTGVRRRRAYAVEIVELIRADFLYLAELARKHNYRQIERPATPAGVPLPESAALAEWSARFVETAAYSSLRPGEIAGALRRNLDGAWMRIEERGVLYTGKREAGTKSRSYHSKTVLLLGPLPEMLAGLKRHPDELLLPWPYSGKMLSKESYRRWRATYYGPIARARGLTGASADPYALRHVYASLRLAAHHSPFEIGRSMGTGLVERTYGDVIEQYAGKGPIDIDETIQAAREAAIADYTFPDG